MSNHKLSVDEILLNLVKYVAVGKGITLKQAKDQLTQLLLEAVPNEQEYGSKNDKFNDWTRGWNNCREVYEANIKKIMREE